MSTYKTLEKLKNSTNQNIPFVIFEQFQNAQYNIVRVAKTTSFSFFCMMQTAHPIYCNISLLLIQLNSRS